MVFRLFKIFSISIISGVSIFFCFGTSTGASFKLKIFLKNFVIFIVPPKSFLFFHKFFYMPRSNLAT